jgi:hypothetical protein
LVLEVLGWSAEDQQGKPLTLGIAPFESSKTGEGPDKKDRFRVLRFAKRKAQQT